MSNCLAVSACGCCRDLLSDIHVPSACVSRSDSVYLSSDCFVFVPCADVGIIFCGGRSRTLARCVPGKRSPRFAYLFVCLLQNSDCPVVDVPLLGIEPALPEGRQRRSRSGSGDQPHPQGREVKLGLAHPAVVGLRGDPPIRSKWAHGNST